MANGIFNAEQYLELYPALVEAGITVDTAWDHYATYGAGELRAPNAELDGKVYAASVLNYANANEDVAEYFGIATPATSLTQQQNADVMLQYVLYGNGEERDAKIIDAPVIVDDSDLVAAINDYQDAKQAELDAIKAAAKELDLDEETKEAVENAETEAAEELTGLDPHQIEDFDNEELTPAVRAQLLKAKEDTLKAELAAQEDLQGKKLGAAKALASAQLRYETAEENVEKAGEDVEAATESFNVYGGNVDPEIDADVNGKFEITGGNTVHLVYVNGKAKFVADDAGNADLSTPANPDDVKAIEKVKGYSAYVDAFVAQEKAEEKLKVAEASALTAAQKYDKDVTKVEIDANGDMVITGMDVDLEASYEAYQGSYANLQTFNELAKDYKDAAAQLAKVTAAGKDVDAAAEVLDDMGYELVVDEFATENDDLFIYNEDANFEYYFDFGAEGDDLFFFGTQFNFVELKASDDIAKGGFGDKNAFEIFAQQDGNDVVLYVETNEVGGTATGAADLDQITLVGVDLADLQWEGGFLTVA